MKASDDFKTVISAHLELCALRDPLFAITLQKENKSIDGCIEYILSTVQSSGINGFDDNEIFSMAVHYYDEDKLKGSLPKNIKVVINHAPVLSEDEIAKAKQQALQDVVNEEKARLTRKKTVTKAVENLDNGIKTELF